MYEVVKLNASDERVKRILRAALPGYRGRRVRLMVSGRGEPRLLYSYWEGGSRSVWRAVGVTPGCGVRVEEVPTHGSNFDGRPREEYKQPLGAVLVKHSQGSHETVYLLVREDDAELIAYLRPAAAVSP